MLKFYIKTYGCQMNQRDSEALECLLESRGYVCGESEEDADILIFNTCSVRDAAERKAKGYSSAWLHHKGRNKHHLEYWIDYSPEGDHPLVGNRMPVKYVVEMFCDRMAASKTYRKELYTDRDPFDYYINSKNSYLLHPDTKALLEELLTMLKDQGETATFAYIRNHVLKKRK